MPSVFISHSSVDKPFVRTLADHLEREDGIKVWLDEREIAPGANIVNEIAGGLDSDFVLLILSPHSVESNWVKEEWTDAFWEQTNSRRAKLAVVLFRDCQIPRLLKNKKYFDLRTNHPDGFRQIVYWLRTERPAPPLPVNPLPTRPPLFVGREADLDVLGQRLQPGVVLGLSGMPGRGKTTLALEFAHRAQTNFSSVYWLACQSGSLPSIAGDLARQLGLSLSGDIQQVVAELKHECARQRCLLILDNVEAEEPGALLPGGVASVLVTTRQPGLRFLRNHPERRLELFNEAQCFALFRRVIGEDEVAQHEAACRALFQRAGYLPLVIDLAASAVKYDSYTIPGIAASFPSDVTAYIAKVVQELPPEPRRLLAAMSACAPEGFRLALAALVADRPEAESLSALRHLVARSMVDELNRSQGRYRLHTLIRETANDTASRSEFAKRQAEALHQEFEAWEVDWKTCEQDLPDFQLALRWALDNDASFNQSLAFYGSELGRRVGRLSQAFEIQQRMSRHAEIRGDKNAEQAWLGNQALILRAWGRLEEALALHKQEEAICLELGNKDGLQACYGNQALILSAWGRLEEALALHKQKEAICLELGNKDGVGVSYGNQALILKAWGRLEEALALHKQEEAICLELGNKDGLQACYGNQALILQAWGRLEEALTLHKQEEAICLELGNKDSLQRSYGNQALILQAWGRLEEALALHKQEEAICLELGNKDSLQRSYGNQALILSDWGRPEEALALLKQQEAICLELGNKDGLQACYGNQALILKAWGRLEEALALHKQKEAICLELGNKDSLQRSYGNQALILQAWGRLEEALALHKQEEAICLELGNKDSLQRSYGNQALILKAWGRLEEALALLKQQETICLELGNKSGLAYCYWTWGLLAREHEDPQTVQVKLKAALALFTKLGMPRHRDAVAAELDQARQAGA